MLKIKNHPEFFVAFIRIVQKSILQKDIAA